MNLKEFEKQKEEIKKNGEKYSHQYHDYWSWYEHEGEEKGYKTIVNKSYSKNLYPEYEEISDAQTNKSYILNHYAGTKEIIETNAEYRTYYILIIDGHFIHENEDKRKLWEYVANNYSLSIDYYGRMTKEEIIKREYTDNHEGNECFIADVINLKTNQSICIEVIDVNYIDNYLDEKDIERAFEEYKQYCTKRNK